MRTAAAETKAATAAIGVLFFEMMFLGEDEAIVEERMEKRGSWGSFIDKVGWRECTRGKPFINLFPRRMPLN